MSTRPELVAQRREIIGKHVARLRRAGQLPAVLYGHGLPSESLQVDARDFATLRRTTGRNALVDLKVDGHRARPVMIHAVQEDPIARRPMHVDFFLVKMTEELTVDVSVVVFGESNAVAKLGGTLLHDLDSVRVRGLPADLPSRLEVDASRLVDFETILHVADLVLPPRVTLLTDAHEALVHVAPPRTEEVAPTVAEAETEAVAPPAGATPSGEGDAG